MAPPSLSRALGLGLLALCLLALPGDARARPAERRVGERQNLSLSDPQVQKAAQAAVASYNMGSNSLYYFRDTRILKAQSQVWTGGRVRGERQPPTRLAGLSAGGQVEGVPQRVIGTFSYDVVFKSD